MEKFLYPFYIVSGLFFAFGWMITLGMGINFCIVPFKRSERSVKITKMIGYAMGIGCGVLILWLMNYITSCVGSRTDFNAVKGITIGVVLSLILTVPGLLAIVRSGYKGEQHSVEGEAEEIELVI